MDKVYNHKDVEEKIYQDWEEKGYFKPEINPNGKPYCIMLPLRIMRGLKHSLFLKKCFEPRENHALTLIRRPFIK